MGIAHGPLLTGSATPWALQMSSAFRLIRAQYLHWAHGKQYGNQQHPFYTIFGCTPNSRVRTVIPGNRERPNRSFRVDLCDEYHVESCIAVHRRPAFNYIKTYNNLPIKPLTAVAIPVGLGHWASCCSRPLNPPLLNAPPKAKQVSTSPTVH